MLEGELPDGPLTAWPGLKSGGGEPEVRLRLEGERRGGGWW
jgi:hypothetical protein